MKKQKKISANLPADLLAKACDAANLNQTEALIAGLQELIRHHARKKISNLKGKIKINFDADDTRERIRL